MRWRTWCGSAPGSAATTPSELRAARAALLADGERTGAELRAALVELVDGWLAGLLPDEPDIALVAVGGYGRREPVPGSDVDLLLLHRGRKDVAELADRIWYPIWDTGISLDHSVRTVAESLAVARADLKAALGLLDARHVAGDEQLTEELATGARAAWRSGANRRLPELVAAARQRAEEFGELSFLLEPDVKEARGGLRDVHAIRAAATTWLVDAPGPRVRDAYALLLDVRTALHRRTGRNSDVLLLQEQDAVAADLGLGDADELMTRVSAAGRTIAFAADETWRRVTAAITPAPRRWRRGGAQPVRRPLAEGVVEQDGEVVLARDTDPRADPVLPLRAAAAAAQAGLPLAPHTLERLTEAPPPGPPWPAAARQAFVALLGAGRPAVQVVEAMDQHGLLDPLFPEWAAVRCRPQRNAYHRFTVDRHLVEAAVEAAALSRDVARPDLLLLGAFLHDIGKGFAGDHSATGADVAAAILRRMGVADDDVRTVVAMVRHHLLLPDTAVRRDLDDPATVRLVADAVGDRDTLYLLGTLAEADGRATGPAAWSEWKSGLVRELVRRAAAVLDGAPPPRPGQLTPEQQRLADSGELAVAVDGDAVTIVAPDRPGLLWRWAGVLALHRLDVRGATATSVGPTAVTVLEAAPRFGSPPDWDLVRDDVRRAYDDALPLADRLAERDRAYRRGGAPTVPPRVLFFDDASEHATVVEVRAHDAVGLLYRIARALADCALDVRAARVSTLGAEAVDAFYVLDRTGAQVTDPEQRAAIEAAILAALG